MTASADVNLWSSAEHALEYLRIADSIPHRVEGEATLLEFVPPAARRILDIGSGGGRLLALVKAARPEAQFVAMDFSLTMLGGARKAFCRFPPCAKGAKGRGTRPCFHRGPRLRQSTFRSGAGAL